MSCLTYCLHGGNKYRLLPNAPDCYVKKRAKNIGYFETMSISSHNLHIDHFAVDYSVIGERSAETMLRGFAALVATQAPAVSQISFDLGRATSNSNIFSLATAREKLFCRIGATDIQQRSPNNSCIVVSAVWNKQAW